VVTTVAVWLDPAADVERAWLAAWLEQQGASLTLPPAAADALVVVVQGGPSEVPPRGRGPRLWVDLLDADGNPRPRGVPDDEPLLRGRGIEAVRWAVAQAARRASSPPERRSLGPSPDQYAEVRRPAQGDGPFPAALLLHGGFWRERWTLDTIEPLAVDLARRGYVTWNLEYRRVGPSDGGWPRTEEDVVSAVRALGADPLVDPERIVLIGHSAGGQLAAAVAAGERCAPVRPRLVVSLAGVLDLVLCARRGLGDTGNAAVAYVGGRPEEVPERYLAASPLALLPAGVPQLVVQGSDDGPDLVEMGRRYVAAARAAGDPVEHLEAPGHHFTVIDAGSELWAQTAERIAAALA
jgi:acetyl esterase/lipase